MRTALLPVTAGILLTACTGSSLIRSDAAAEIVDATETVVFDANEAGVDATPDVPMDVTYIRPPPITRTDPESVLAARRLSCAFDAGAWPAETLGTEIPVGSDIPVDHVVLIMLENRSFDSYYSHLPEYGQPDVEVAPSTWTNPDAMGHPVARVHDTTQYCIADTNHSWNGSHREWDNGMNDGFVVQNDPNGERSLYYYDETDIPFYYSLANTFAIADHYHASLLGPTNPNRFFSMAATSFGHTYNAPYTDDTVAHPVDQIFRRLDLAGFDWRDYAGGLRSPLLFPNYSLFNRATAAHFGTISQLMSNIASGDLPPFSLVDPTFGGPGGDAVDEHPPGTPMGGEAFVESIVRALMTSPAWAHTVLFITYDEHGGWADHVPPPAACPPDGHMPIASDGSPATGAFDRLGFRVPFTVVSPFARRHFVSHTTYDHTSILRFIEARFGLPAMTARDANATPPMDMFDFANPPFMTPPTDLAHGRGVDAALRAHCNTQFPGP